MKKYILYSGVIVCFIACFMICMFWGVQKKTSLHSYTTKMDLLTQDNILDSVKREVSDFLWCGYSPDTYMELEQKSEVPRSEIFPYVYSTPILKAYQIEKQAYAGSFDSIPDDQEAVYYPARSAKAKNVLPEDRVELPNKSVADAWGKKAK